jgi:peptide/nickel transport system substrate-binding protein
VGNERRNGNNGKEIDGRTTPLSFSISTSETPELLRTAEIVTEEWRKMGVEANLRIFESRDDLSQNAIRPRKYDALLFGMVVRRGVDFYPFWHSSQRNDPGLNIALYANISVDRLLENSRTIFERDELEEINKKLEQEIASDIPAVFLYSPYFIYVIPEKVKNVNLGQIDSLEDRFSDIHEWYIRTNKIWKIFHKE